MGIGKEFIELMDKLNYQFRDITYLQTALTHSSFSHEMKMKGFRTSSNEELEFLGDAVLQLVISDELYTRFIHNGEGALTKMRQKLVCEATLARLAAKLDLGLYLNIGTGEEALDLRSRTKVLADALEAVFAAVYIDDNENGNGLYYRHVVLNLFSEVIEEAYKEGTNDYKTMLQQFVEKNGDSVLEYVSEEIGPEHEKTFNVKAFINNNLVGSGVGQTKKAAEMLAARSALILFGILKEQSI